MEIWDQKNNRKCLGFPQYLYVKFVTLIPVIFGADVRGVTEEGSYYILRVEKSLSDGIMNYKLWSLSRPSSRARHRCLAPWQPGDFCCTETERAVVYRGVHCCTLVSVTQIWWWWKHSTQQRENVESEYELCSPVHWLLFTQPFDGDTISS